MCSVAKPRDAAPHPISFFLKKKETKKITFADGMCLQICGYFCLQKERNKTAGRCPAPHFFLLKEERNKEDNFCRRNVTANLQLHYVCKKRDSKGLKALWSGVWGLKAPKVLSFSFCRVKPSN
jgi:hypothetical protein